MIDIHERYWLWTAFCSESTLLYGCLVRCPEPWAEIDNNYQNYSIKIEKNDIQIIQSIIKTEDAKQITNTVNTSSILDLSRHGGPKFEIAGFRDRIMDSFTRRAQPVRTHVCRNLPQFSDAEWQASFSFLKDTLGIDFQKTCDRVGTFDIFDQFYTNTINNVINFQAHQDLSSGDAMHPECFKMTHTGIIESAVKVHIQLKLGEDLVFSQLVHINYLASKDVKAVCFDKYRMFVFTSCGTQIQFEEESLFLRAALNMSMMTQTLIIDDSLSRSSKSLDPTTRNRAAMVRPRSTNRSLVGVKDLAFDVHRTRMRALTRRLAPTDGQDRWFPRGITHEVNVISYINSLLDSTRVGAAIIVDPYFSVETLKRLVARIENLDIALTVVTSLGTLDAETDKQNPGLIDELHAALKGIRRGRVPSATRQLRVINLVDGSNPAFHDRYLLVTPHEGEREVFLLSNSLNRMAGKWPFCLSKLDSAAARDAGLYIDGLASGRDISGSTQPVVTFEWP